MNAQGGSPSAPSRSWNFFAISAMTSLKNAQPVSASPSRIASAALARSSAKSAAPFAASPSPIISAAFCFNSAKRVPSHGFAPPQVRCFSRRHFSPSRAHRRFGSESLIFGKDSGSRASQRPQRS